MADGPVADAPAELCEITTCSNQSDILKSDTTAAQLTSCVTASQLKPESYVGSHLFTSGEIAARATLEGVTDTHAHVPVHPCSSQSSMLERIPSPASFVESPPAENSHCEPESPTAYDRDHLSDQIIRLKPTLSQWQDMPRLLSLARELGAKNDGCFKIVLPDGALDPLPVRIAQTVKANGFKPQIIRSTRAWRVETIPSEAYFQHSLENTGPEFKGTAESAVERLSVMFSKQKNRQLRDVRYRVDVPAWTADQRLAAGVPDKSPLHPLRGDKLDRTRAKIPGIHTPYVYESGPSFGATFQIHAEDFRLSSLNHLYKGRKIWIVIPSTAVDSAEEKMERKGKCSQFMRHRAEFLFPRTLARLKIPYRLIDQRPGETLVILPDAYHEGFSTGHTLAEAKNYAESDWTPDTYQPCDDSCQLATAIPGDLMRLVEDGEEQLDLCAQYDEQLASAKKRSRGEVETEDENASAEKSYEGDSGAPLTKRAKLSPVSE